MSERTKDMTNDTPIRITFSSTDEKDRIEICPSELGKAISSLAIGSQCEVFTPRKIISQLQYLLALLEEAVGKQQVTQQITERPADEFCAPLYETEYETNKYNKLIELAQDWNKPPISNFNMDGFYPFYYNQPVRILFVGREACYMAGKDYIKTVHDLLVNNNLSGWTVNQYPFHRRQFYLAYGILRAYANGNTQPKFPEWDDVPSASNMASGENRIFAVNRATNDQSISWAFINLSKVSNESGDYRTSPAYRSFVEDTTNQKFLRKQIEILSPDLIISANVYELLDILGYEKDNGVDTQNKNCYFYPPCKSKITQKELPPFLNCYHFAAIKSDRHSFYDPVCDVLRKHNDIVKGVLSKRKNDLRK